MATFDESGAEIRDDQPSPETATRVKRPRGKMKARRRANNLGDFSVGASVWEIFHPGAVQQEAAAVGAAIPSKADVIFGGISDAVQGIPDAIGAAVDTGGSALDTVKKLAMIGAVLYIAVLLLKSKD